MFDFLWRTLYLALQNESQNGCCPSIIDSGGNNFPQVAHGVLLKLLINLIIIVDTINGIAK